MAVRPMPIEKEMNALRCNHYKSTKYLDPKIVLPGTRNQRVSTTRLNIFFPHKIYQHAGNKKRKVTNGRLKTKTSDLFSTYFYVTMLN